MGAGRPTQGRAGEVPAEHRQSASLPFAGPRLLDQAPAARVRYARVSTQEQDFALQLDALKTAGRPPALKAKDLAAAKALLKDPEITVV